MQPITVMNLVDSLDFGGTERMAINIVNHLPADKYRAVLCTTRHEGALAKLVSPHVVRLRLTRRCVSDHLASIRTLRTFIEENDVRILHAHSSSIFISRLAMALTNRTALVWHAHWGAIALKDCPAWPYRVASLGIDAAIGVNRDLVDWIRRRFPIRDDRVWYLPNIATAAAEQSAIPGDLPGVPGKRIVCVANIRPEKDHITLVRAMALLCRKDPEAHLILVGVPLISNSVEALRREIDVLGLRKQITYLGPREDAQAIMQKCDIGVLSSVSEGLPVALLEYGMANLAVVATPAGQTADVVGSSDAGLMVPFRSPGALADALEQLLRDPALRNKLAKAFNSRITVHYGAKAVVEQLTQIYDVIL